MFPLLNGKLIRLNEDGTDGEIIQTIGPTLTVGTSILCDCVISGSDASPIICCEIATDNLGRVTISNKSTCELLVNDKPVCAKRPLLSNSIIKVLNSIEFRWIYTNAKEESQGEDELKVAEYASWSDPGKKIAKPSRLLKQREKGRLTVHPLQLYSTTNDANSLNEAEADSIMEEDEENPSIIENVHQAMGNENLNFSTVPNDLQCSPSNSISKITNLSAEEEDALLNKVDSDAEDDQFTELNEDVLLAGTTDDDDETDNAFIIQQNPTDIRTETLNELSICVDKLQEDKSISSAVINMAIPTNISVGENLNQSRDNVTDEAMPTPNMSIDWNLMVNDECNVAAAIKPTNSTENLTKEVKEICETESNTADFKDIQPHQSNNSLTETPDTENKEEQCTNTRLDTLLCESEPIDSANLENTACTTRVETDVNEIDTIERGQQQSDTTAVIELIPNTNNEETEPSTSAIVSLSENVKQSIEEPKAINDQWESMFDYVDTTNASIDFQTLSSEYSGIATVVDKTMLQSNSDQDNNTDFTEIGLNKAAAIATESVVDSEIDCSAAAHVSECNKTGSDSIFSDSQTEQADSFRKDASDHESPESLNPSFFHDSGILEQKAEGTDEMEMDTKDDSFLQTEDDFQNNDLVIIVNESDNSDSVITVNESDISINPNANQSEIVDKGNDSVNEMQNEQYDLSDQFVVKEASTLNSEDMHHEENSFSDPGEQDDVENIEETVAGIEQIVEAFTTVETKDENSRFCLEQTPLGDNSKPLEAQNKQGDLPKQIFIEENHGQPAEQLIEDVDSIALHQVEHGDIENVNDSIDDIENVAKALAIATSEIAKSKLSSKQITLENERDDLSQLILTDENPIQQSDEVDEHFALIAVKTPTAGTEEMTSLAQEEIEISVAVIENVAEPISIVASDNEKMHLTSVEQQQNSGTDEAEIIDAKDDTILQTEDDVCSVKNEPTHSDKPNVEDETSAIDECESQEIASDSTAPEAPHEQNDFSKDFLNPENAATTTVEMQHEGITCSDQCVQVETENAEGAIAEALTTTVSENEELTARTEQTTLGDLSVPSQKEIEQQDLSAQFLVEDTTTQLMQQSENVEANLNPIEIETNTDNEDKTIFDQAASDDMDFVKAIENVAEVSATVTIDDTLGIVSMPIDIPNEQDGLSQQILSEENPIRLSDEVNEKFAAIAVEIDTKEQTSLVENETENPVSDIKNVNESLPMVSTNVENALLGAEDNILHASIVHTEKPFDNEENLIFDQDGSNADENIKDSVGDIENIAAKDLPTVALDAEKMQLDSEDEMLHESFTSTNEPHNEQRSAMDELIFDCSDVSTLNVDGSETIQADDLSTNTDFSEQSNVPAVVPSAFGIQTSSIDDAQTLEADMEQLFASEDHSYQLSDKGQLHAKSTAENVYSHVEMSLSPQLFDDEPDELDDLNRELVCEFNREIEQTESAVTNELVFESEKEVAQLATAKENIIKETKSSKLETVLASMMDVKSVNVDTMPPSNSELDNASTETLITDRILDSIALSVQSANAEEVKLSNREEIHLSASTEVSRFAQLPSAAKVTKHDIKINPTTGPQKEVSAQLKYFVINQTHSNVESDFVRAPIVKEKIVQQADKNKSMKIIETFEANSEANSNDTQEKRELRRAEQVKVDKHEKSEMATPSKKTVCAELLASPRTPRRRNPPVRFVEQVIESAKRTRKQDLLEHTPNIASENISVKTAIIEKTPAKETEKRELTISPIAIESRANVPEISPIATISHANVSKVMPSAKSKRTRKQDSLVYTPIVAVAPETTSITAKAVEKTPPNETKKREIQISPIAAVSHENAPKVMLNARSKRTRNHELLVQTPGKKSVITVVLQKTPTKEAKPIQEITVLPIGSVSHKKGSKAAQSYEQQPIDIATKERQSKALATPKKAVLEQRNEIKDGVQVTTSTVSITPSPKSVPQRSTRAIRHVGKGENVISPVSRMATALPTQTQEIFAIQTTSDKKPINSLALNAQTVSQKSNISNEIDPLDLTTQSVATKSNEMEKMPSKISKTTVESVQITPSTRALRNRNPPARFLDSEYSTPTKRTPMKNKKLNLESEKVPTKSTTKKAVSDSTHDAQPNLLKAIVLLDFDAKDVVQNSTEKSTVLQNSEPVAKEAPKPAAKNSKKAKRVTSDTNTELEMGLVSEKKQADAQLSVPQKRDEPVVIVDEPIEDGKNKTSSKAANKRKRVEIILNEPAISKMDTDSVKPKRITRRRGTGEIETEKITHEKVAVQQTENPEQIGPITRRRASKDSLAEESKQETKKPTTQKSKRAVRQPKQEQDQNIVEVHNDNVMEIAELQPAKRKRNLSEKTTTEKPNNQVTEIAQPDVEAKPKRVGRPRKASQTQSVNDDVQSEKSSTEPNSKESRPKRGKRRISERENSPESVIESAQPKKIQQKTSIDKKEEVISDKNPLSRRAKYTTKEVVITATPITAVKTCEVKIDEIISTDKPVRKRGRANSKIEEINETEHSVSKKRAPKRDVDAVEPEQESTTKQTRTRNTQEATKTKIDAPDVNKAEKPDAKNKRAKRNLKLDEQIIIETEEEQIEPTKSSPSTRSRRNATAYKETANETAPKSAPEPAPETAPESGTRKRNLRSHK